MCHFYNARTNGILRTICRLRDNLGFLKVLNDADKVGESYVTINIHDNH